MKTPIQDPAAAVTYLSDWTDHLDALPYGGITIASATVTVDRGAVIDSKATIDTGVMFRLTVADAALGAFVTVTVSVVLSNGDTDVRRHSIMVQKT